MPGLGRRDDIILAFIGFCLNFIQAVGCPGFDRSFVFGSLCDLELPTHRGHGDCIGGWGLELVGFFRWPVAG